MSEARDILGAWGAPLGDEDVGPALAAAGVLAGWWSDVRRAVGRRNAPDVALLLVMALEEARDDAVRWESPFVQPGWRSLEVQPMGALQLRDAWTSVASGWGEPIRFAIRERTLLQRHGWDLLWLVRTLSGPRVAHDASAFLDTGGAPAGLRWSWPLTVGVPAHLAAPMADIEQERAAVPDGWMATALRPLLLGGRHHGAALVVLDGPVERWETWLARERPDADVVLAIVDGAAELPRAMESLDADGRHPITAAVVSDDPAQTLTQLLWDLTHNVALDLALSLAAQHAAGASGYLVRGPAGAIERIRLRRRVAATIRELRGTSALPRAVEAAPIDDLLDVPATGSPPTDRTVAEMLDELDQVLALPAYFREADGAVPLALVNEATRSVREDGGPVRFVQARVTDADGATLHAFVAGHTVTITVFVGPTEMDTVVGDVGFPDDELAAGREHLLTVLLSSADLDQVLRAEVRLPQVGRSGDAAFTVDVPARLESLSLRITVLHGGRVLQSWLLTGRVATDVTTAREPSEDLRLTLESAPRLRTTDLHTRRSFDLAVIANHDGKGRPGGVAMPRAGAPVLLPLQDDQVGEGLKMLRQTLETRLADDEAATDIRSDEMIAFLAAMAHRGVPLRRLLERTAPGFTTRTGMTRNLQLLSATPDAYLPLELVYDHAAPSGEPSSICEAGVTALATDELRDCTEDHDEATVCPLGFWGLRHVIERRLFVPGGVEGGVGWNAESEPAEGREEIRLSRRVLFAASDRVDGVVAGTRARAVATLTAVTELTRAVKDWQAWKDGIQGDRPSVLVALPHTLNDALRGNAMSVGATSLLGAGEITRAHVVANDGDRVVALLIGCRTGVDDVPFAHFPAGFQSEGASVVIATLAKVHGRHAGPVAADLANTILDPAPAQVTLGERLVQVRRRALLQHGPIGLSLVAYGDADWVLAPEVA